jgi:cell filamentation protein
MAAGIYEWAGSYRNVNLSKNNFPFAAAKMIPLLMKQFEKEFLQKHTPCKFKSFVRIVQSLAEVHVELILIHPFREGNGRLARLLSMVMASQAGLPILDFTDITGRKRKEYFSAIQSGLERDYKPMEKIFSRVIERSLKI